MATTRRPGRPPDPALDAAIADATMSLLAEVGYDRLTIDAVARRAGTARTSVYRRLPNKEELVVHALRHLPTRPAGPPDTGSLRGDLLAHVRLVLADLTGDRVAGITGLFLASRDKPALAELVRTHLTAGTDTAMATILARAGARGEIDPAAPMNSFLPHLASSQLYLRVLVLQEDVPDADLVRLVDELLLPLVPGGSS